MAQHPSDDGDDRDFLKKAPIQTIKPNRGRRRCRSIAISRAVIRRQCICTDQAQIVRDEWADKKDEKQHTIDDDSDEAYIST